MTKKPILTRKLSLILIAILNVILWMQSQRHAFLYLLDIKYHTRFYSSNGIE